jgi:hypothetical protein
MRLRKIRRWSTNDARIAAAIKADPRLGLLDRTGSRGANGVAILWDQAIDSQDNSDRQDRCRLDL